MVRGPFSQSRRSYPSSSSEHSVSKCFCWAKQTILCSFSVWSSGSRQMCSVKALEKRLYVARESLALVRGVSRSVRVTDTWLSWRWEQRRASEPRVWLLLRGGWDSTVFSLPYSGLLLESTHYYSRRSKFHWSVGGLRNENLLTNNNIYYSYSQWNIIIGLV